MKVELQCRFKKLDLTEDEKAYQEAQRIIGKEDITFDANDESFTYEPIVLDLKDIRGFNPVDSKHTCVRTYQLDSFIVGAPYHAFFTFYQEMTGDLIKRLTIKYE